ncbi:MAG: hypothetical protein DYH12_30130, partial [Sorangiineae bacterium PRO1]|nr:hypothetical protein [Sorangiineae bacterium PRO1]
GFNLLSDTWEWNGSTWSQRFPATSPAVRASASMTWDASRQRVVLFAGESSAGKLSDTWEWNGTTWAQRSAGNPPAVTSPTLAFDTLRARLMFAGGSASTGTLAQTWCCSPRSSIG